MAMWLTTTIDLYTLARKARSRPCTLTCSGIATYGRLFLVLYVLLTHTWVDTGRSYSWSSNVCGRKHWVFFSPDQEQYLRDAKGEFIHDVRAVDTYAFCMLGLVHV